MNKLLGIIKPHLYVVAINTQGCSFVQNSKGNKDSISLKTIIQLDATNNNLLFVEYRITLFNFNDPDYVEFITTNYNEAINKYNELLTKWHIYKGSQKDNSNEQ